MSFGGTRRRIAAAVGLVACALGIFPEWFGLGAVTPFVQAVAYRPQVSAVVLVGALLVSVRRSWRLVGLATSLPAVVAIAMMVPRVTSEPAAVPNGARVITLMVANQMGGGADTSAVARVIRERRPDLVSLPESTADVRESIQDRLEDLRYRGYTQQASPSIASATSVLVAPSMGDVRFEAELLGGGTVSGHVGAETIGPVRQTTTQFGHVIVTGGSLHNLRVIVYHGYPPFPFDTASWTRDLEAVRTWCDQDVPTILAGDFNATSDHSEFHRALGNRCRSVAPAVGEGLAGTWPSGWLSVARVQIDHVVVSEGIVPMSFKAYKIPGTDHLAAVATVAVQDS